MPTTSIVAHNKQHLLRLIRACISEHGWNCNLCHIDVSKVTDLSRLFSTHYGLNTFNGDISSWDVSNVISLEGTFENSDFRGDLSGWDVSNVVTMRDAFSGAIPVPSIHTWSVRRVIDMHGIFSNSWIDINLSEWDVQNVTNFVSAFEDAFTSDIARLGIQHWNPSSAVYMDKMFYNFNSRSKNMTAPLLEHFHKAALDLSHWNLRCILSMDRFSSTSMEITIPAHLDRRSVVAFTQENYFTYWRPYLVDKTIGEDHFYCYHHYPDVFWHPLWTIRHIQLWDQLSVLNIDIIDRCHLAAQSCAEISSLSLD